MITAHVETLCRLVARAVAGQEPVQVHNRARRWGQCFWRRKIIALVELGFEWPEYGDFGVEMLNSVIRPSEGIA